MIKGLSIAFSSFVFLFFSTISVSADSTYLRVFAGDSILDDTSVTSSLFTGSYEITYSYGQSAGLAFGKKYGPMRIEGALAYRNNEVNWFRDYFAVEGEFRSKSLLANVFYNLSISEYVNPYIGAGIGYAKVDSKDLLLPDGTPGGRIIVGDENDTTLTYQLAFGLSFSLISRKMFLDLSYTQFKMMDLKWEGVDLEYGGHSSELGLRVHF